MVSSLSETVPLLQQPSLEASTSSDQPNSLVKIKRYYASNMMMIGSSVFLTMGVAGILTACWMDQKCVESLKDPNEAEKICFTLDRYVMSGVYGFLGTVSFVGGLFISHSAKKLG